MLVGANVGVLVMWDLVAKALGADGSDPEAGMRIRRGMVEMFANRLISPDMTAHIQEAFDRTRRQPLVAEPHSAERPEAGATEAAGEGAQR